ncbi:MAG TPA: hypothetical protein VGV67_14460 [Solirubrobacteraceae bacterium]|nr:hypothetical protein [Solirubrobacteraceae bacterium]
MLELGARHHIRGCLLMIDLDGCKEIDDNHGHARGGAALAPSRAACAAADAAMYAAKRNARNDRP